MIFVSLLWVLFIVSALLLCLVILIQEGKGGGLAEAFGGQGAETFGVKATGVNYFTGGLAVAMFLTAILINKCGYERGSVRFDSAPAGAPSGDAGAGAPASGDAGGGDTNEKK